MSLIDREDLMLTLGITNMDCEKCEWYSRTARICKRGSDFEDACIAINYAPEVKPEPKWIPVSDRLPEKPNIYTVTDSKGDVVRLVFYDTESSREYWIRCAKAWMPLSELYREEGD